MTIEIKTDSVQPIRHTYSHIARRFGDKPATRYQEASFDIAATTNFHYRPLWDAEHELNDVNLSAVKMKDWYEITDPRQFYYGAYVGNRAKMQEGAETSYGFCEKRGLLKRLDERVQTSILKYLVHFRHMNQAANMNNSSIASEAVGATAAQPHIFQAMDHLGMGQYLSRIALMIDGNTGSALDISKNYWMNDPIWQPLRKLAEDSMVVRDWFELTVLQNLLIDKAIFAFAYEALDDWFAQQGAEDISMLTEFMRDWNKDTLRWVTAVVKTAAAESDSNREAIQSWVDKWEPEIFAALKPLAMQTTGIEALENVHAQLAKTLQKAGLQTKGFPA